MFISQKLIIRVILQKLETQVLGKLYLITVESFRDADANVKYIGQRMEGMQKIAKFCASHEYQEELSIY